MAGRALVLSPCPLSMRWRGGAGVRLADSCPFQAFHSLGTRFGSGLSSLRTTCPTSEPVPSPGWAPSIRVWTLRSTGFPAVALFMATRAERFVKGEHFLASRAQVEAWGEAETEVVPAKLY